MPHEKQISFSCCAKSYGSLQKRRMKRDPDLRTVFTFTLRKGYRSRNECRLNVAAVAMKSIIFNKSVYNSEFSRGIKYDVLFQFKESSSI